jgi:hypothetical protein
MEAMVRTASHLIGHDDSMSMDWHQLRGVKEIIKTAEIPGVGKVAICNGIAAAQEMLENERWRNEFVAIEVMACVGGCLGGGGEPKSLDPHILHKRMQAIYEIDKDAPKRRSYENRDVQKLYETGLHEPNSDAAKALLHTSFAPRNSKRLLLMKFLDCVDRRDAQGAAALFHPDALWSTASPFGEIHGTEAIAAFIGSQLPERKYGAHFMRHKMASASSSDDLSVITPMGERCRFTIELEPVGINNASNPRITKLVREVL